MRSHIWLFQQISGKLYSTLPTFSSTRYSRRSSEIKTVLPWTEGILKLCHESLSTPFQRFRMRQILIRVGTRNSRTTLCAAAGWNSYCLRRQRNKAVKIFCRQHAFPGSRAVFDLNNNNGVSKGTNRYKLLGSIPHIHHLQFHSGPGYPLNTTIGSG